MSKPKEQIKYLVVLGDSLSDRGTFKTKKSWLGPLILKDSPKARFTDAEVWGDVLARDLADKAIHKKLVKLKQKVEAYTKKCEQDLDAKQRKHYEHKLSNAKKAIEALKLERTSTAHHRKVNYAGQRFFRSYAEGGLTTGIHSLFEWQPINILSSRALLTNMKEKIKRLLRDDKYYSTSDKQKKQTLVVEWSGANDLLTVNKELSFEVAEKAVHDRIKHVRSLVDQGYTHVVLFNLPDFSLTPRFQARSKKEQQKARAVSNYYNDLLKKEMDKLKTEVQVEQLDVFDVNTLFKQEINARLKKGEKVFEIAPSTGVEGSGAHQNYLFFDDVHPTAQLQNKIASQFLKSYGEKIDITPEVLSAQELFEQFKAIAQAVGHCEIDLEALEAEKKGNYQAVFETLFKHSLKKPRSNVSKALKRGQFFTSEVHPELVQARQKHFPALQLDESYQDLYERAKSRYETLCYQRRSHHRFLEILNQQEEVLETGKGFLSETDYEQLLKRMVEHTYEHPAGLLSNVFESLQFFTLKHPGLNRLRQEVVDPYRIEWEGMIHPESLYLEFKKRYMELDSKRGGFRFRSFLKELNTLEAELSMYTPLTESDYLLLLARVQKHAKKFPSGLTNRIVRGSRMVQKIIPFIEELQREIIRVPPISPSFKQMKKNRKSIQSTQSDALRIPASKKPKTAP